MFDPADPLRIIGSPADNSARRAKDIVNQLPEQVRPNAGTFEYQFAATCTEIALSAPRDEAGASRATPDAVLQVARLLCARDLSGNSCFSACQMNNRCLGQPKLVLISFGQQARAALRALGLSTEDVTVHDLVREDDVHQPRRLVNGAYLPAPKD